MPEQPEIHWLGWVLLAAVSFSLGILYGAYREYRRMWMKPKEQRRTHRRTWGHNHEPE